MKKTAAVVILLLTGFLFAGFNPGKGELTVVVTGLRNDVGVVRLSLYNQEDGFPSKPERAVLTRKTKINGGVARFRLAGLTHGEYAVAVMHDENNNGDMDKNWIGIPKEGYGCSNDARGTLGPPDYEDARFRLQSGARSIQLKMDYL